MSRVRLVGVAVVTAFAALVGVLAGLGLVPVREAVAALLAVALGFGPTGWLVPTGWQRRVAELALVPAALAMTLLADTTQRAMALPPLLILATLAATAAARRRVAEEHASWLAAACSASIVAASSLGLSGYPIWTAALAATAPVTLALATASWLGLDAGLLVACLGGVLPWARAPLAAAVALALGLAVFLARRAWAPEAGSRHPAVLRVARAWLPGVLAVTLAASTLTPWGLLPLSRAFPHPSPFALPLLVTALAVTPFAPPAAAGAVWLAVMVSLGPPAAAPADRAGISLTAAAPRAALPAATGGPYLLDLALANAGAVPEGTPVATLTVGETSRVLRAGVDAVEWSAPRLGGRVAHPLPTSPVWRPHGRGATAAFAVAGRAMIEVPKGVVPTLERAADLPEKVVVLSAQAGPSRATPPRDWPLPAWVVAAALALAAVQLLGCGAHLPGAALGWAILAAAALLARAQVEPLRLLAERHAIDIALAAFVVGWVPVARKWLARGLPFLAAATLLVPLALATPHLTPPMHGDEPFHLLMLEAITKHHTTDLGRLHGLPYEAARLYSPALAVLLLPGYWLAGRAGALVELALAGAALVAVLWRCVGSLGLTGPRRSVLTLGLLLTYPLATFCTQVWVEVVGALAAAAGVLLATERPARRGWATLAAAAATAVKTRLALVTFPQALAAWWEGEGHRRRRVIALLALSLAAVIGAGVATVFQGHPFGPYRRLHDLLPRSWGQPAVVLGGLLLDPAGGLVFAAPWAVVALLAVPLLWRRGRPAERALLLGGVATVLALLHSPEWYGGGSPPFRYLVPLLPVPVLAGALALRVPGVARRLAWLAVPPSLALAWALVARPQLSINPGQGAWWLSSALARRLQADTWAFFPSFLHLSPATWQVPLGLGAVCGAVVVVAWRWPRTGGTLARLSVTLWLVAAAALVLAVRTRTDQVVELEAAQVLRRGGLPEPPEGTFSRFTHRNGWRLRGGDGITVPLHLAPGARVQVEAWVTAPTGTTAALRAAWDTAPPALLPVAAGSKGSLALPDPPGAGRHRLHLDLQAPSGFTMALDRVVVTP